MPLEELPVSRGPLLHPGTTADIERLQPSNDLEAIIPEITEQLARSLAPRPLAIVLTGSFARGEGSVLLTEDGLRVLGDIEFMVFCSPRANMTELQGKLGRQAKEQALRLAGQGINCELEFSAVSPRYLRTLRPHIFGYELLRHGRVVWGNPDIFSTAREFPPASIPLWDAWRMLNNRLLEQLQWMEGLRNGDRELLERMFYQVLKCYIDIGTTLLIFAGRYQTTYASRMAELLRWNEVVNNQEGLQFLPTIAQRIAACTAFKLSPSSNREPLGVRLHGSTEELREDVERLFAELVPLAHQVWRWEAAQLTNQRLSAGTDDNTLRADVLQTQRVREKIRGWAKLVLMPLVRSQRGFAKRMSTLVGRGSPRYLIYSVASELYFQSLCILKGEEPQVSEFGLLLPVLFAEHEHETRPWWGLRANVLSGWRLFLRNHWA